MDRIVEEKEEEVPYWKSITREYLSDQEKLNKLYRQYYNVYIYQELPYPVDIQPLFIKNVCMH